MRALGALLTLAVAVGCSSPAAVTPGASPTPTLSPTPTPTPTPSPTPTPTPTAPPADTYFSDGTISYVLLPTAIESQILEGLQSAQVKAFIKTSAVRSATKAGEPMGTVVFVLGIDPGFAALPGALEGLITGIVGSASAGAITAPETITIGGRAVSVMFHNQQKLWYLVWQQRTFMVTEFAAVRANGEEVASALIAANSR